MKLSIVDRRVETAWRPAAELVARLERVCASAGLPAWSIDLVWLDDAQMRRLNREFRAEDHVTDVLSFSYLETGGKEAPALAAGTHYAKQDFWLASDAGAGEVVVGEVVIAPAFVLVRADRQGWPLDAELALLTVHGTLHILGWQHANPAAATAMRVCEAELLHNGGFSHPLDEGGAKD